MDKMRRILTFLWIVLCALPLWGQVSFGGLQVSEDNRLLFSAETESPVYDSFKTLFEADLKTREQRALTVFPEKIHYLEDSGKLQFQNRFGMYRSDRDFSSVEAVEGFPSFSEGKAVETGKIRSVAGSPDGRYLIYIEKQSYAYGKLMLFFAGSGETVTVSEDVGLSFDEPAVSWSPDSAYFVYRTRGEIYYYSIDQLKRDEVVKEKFRRIGEGSMRSEQSAAGG